jgi:RNA polymerase sigma-70 factor (ECF subfamily)
VSDHNFDRLSDEELMDAYAKKGNAEAFTLLYQSYESKLYGFFLRRLGQHRREAAPDLFQKTWLKIHHARHRFDSEQKFSTWMYSIALNALRDQLRVAPLEDEIPDLAADTDTEQEFRLKEDLGRLEEALSLIPENHREALILSEWEGFSSQELAKVLGVSDAAARQIVSRARKKVRQILQEREK